MILALLAVVVGFFFLVYTADKFIMAASSLAKQLGISPLVIGLTIVALGTSLPELLVSFMAALANSPELALGNAVGSNITNIGLVVGVTALLKPLDIESKILRREFPIMCAFIVITFLLMQDGHFSKTDGWMMLLMLGGLVTWLIMTGLTSTASDPLQEEYQEELKRERFSKAMAWFWILVSIVLMPLSSRLIVWGAIEIAHYFGLSELIIGLTVIAIGTSLPELVASIMGVVKNEHDIALGNIIGSNMFNLLGVIGLPATIKPIVLDPLFMTRDYFTMTLFTLILFCTAYGHNKPGRIQRAEGLLLFICYITYMMVLYYLNIPPA